MLKKKLETDIKRQVFSLTELVEHQVESCFKSVKNLMSMSEMFNTRKIIITGCGDSYFAALAMKPVIERYCDCFGVNVMRTIEFTRFLSKERIGMGEPNSPIVIVISIGGKTARAYEALEKANQVGAFSIMMTNNSESDAASIAKRVYVLDTPKFANDSPGLRSYFSSILGLVSFAARLGHVRGTLGPTDPQLWKNAIIKYVNDYEPVIDKIDTQMYELAMKWKHFEKFNFIGDDVGHASALFGAAKFIECFGALCSWDDSEEWCHVNYFLNEPEQIGTIIIADKHSTSFNRVLETTESARKIGRPILVITNAEKELFAQGIEVCKLPDTRAGFEWLMPLMDYVPTALLAGYIAEINDIHYFSSIEHNQDAITTSSSLIQIFK